VRKISQKMEREAIDRGESFLFKCSEVSGDMGGCSFKYPTSIGVNSSSVPSY